MALVKRIVCLANSRKMSERCLAGKEIRQDIDRPWIRPVSDKPTQEISLRLRRYRDGRDPGLLDVMEVPVLRHKPHTYQRENWLLDPARRWSCLGKLSWTEAAALADDPPALWTNGSSTRYGLNDRVAEEDACRMTESLYLLRLDSVTLRVHVPAPGIDEFTRRAQAEFTYRGVEYRLRVTDPAIEEAYLMRDDGAYPLGRCLITVSLGEPFRGHCYKLVAAVMPEEPLT